MESATFFSRAKRSLREFTWRHARLILYAVYIAVILIVCALLWLYWPQIPPLHDPLDAWLSAHLGSFWQNVLGSLLATLIVFAVPFAFLRKLDTALRAKLLRINPTLRRLPATQEMLAKYIKVALLQIERLLEDDIKRIAAHRPDMATVLVKMRADERPSESASAYGLRIPDLMHFIDSEYLLTPSENVRPLMIEGAPGSGKSTLLFELFRMLGRRLKEGQGWIPIVVFLHDLGFEALDEGRSVKDVLKSYLLNLVKTLNTTEDKEAVLRMVEFVDTFFNNYRFVIIFDGLDEFTDRTVYRQFSERLNRLMNSAPTNRFFVSCRDEDNFGRITGRTVSIQPMVPKQVDGYLKKLQDVYNEDPLLKAEAGKVGNVRIHLRKSQAVGALQNYVSNPYLLSQIIKYYKEESGVAGDLRMIFKAVLNRELTKANDDLQPQTKFTDLEKYASSLLAPFCYRLALKRLASDEPASGNPEQKSSQPIAGDLGTSLFSTEEGNYGLISGIYWGKSIYTQYDNLAEDWGRPKAAWFRQYLETERLSKRDKTYEEFQARALDYLSNDLVTLIKKANLVKFDPTGAGYNRLRHRRLEDYFTALYVDQRGFGDLIPYLSSGWAREPLRIVSAISPDPTPLIEAFVAEFDRLYAERPVSPFPWLNRLCDLLLNASSAIAYLPRRPKVQADEKLRLAIQGVCVRSVILFSAIRTAQAAHTGTPVRWINLYEISLINFRNLFAAEFWSADWTQSSVMEMLAGEPTVAKHIGRSNWRAIHHIIVKHDRFYQCLAYEHLTPIKEKHGFFPTSRLSLFGYAADLFLFSRGAYVRLVADARPNLRDRWPTTAVFWLERIAWLAVAFAYARWLWNSFGFSLEAGLWLALTVALLLPSAFLVQRRGLLDKWEALHFLPWVMLRAIKRGWSFFTIDEPLLALPPIGGTRPGDVTGVVAYPLPQPEGPGKTGKVAIRMLTAVVIAAIIGAGYPIAGEIWSRGWYQYNLASFLENVSSLDASLRDLSSRIDRKAQPVGDVASLTALEKTAASLQDSVAARRASAQTLTDDPSATPLDRAKVAEAGRRVETAAQLLDGLQSKLATATQVAAFLAAAGKLETDISAQLARTMDSLHGTALENAIAPESALLSNCVSVKAQGRVATAAATGSAATAQLNEAVARIGRSCADLAVAVSKVESRQLVEVAPGLRSQADDALAGANGAADLNALNGLVQGVDRLDSTIANYASRGSEIQANPNAVLDPGMGAALKTLSDAQSQTRKARKLLESKLDEADNSARVDTFVDKTVTPLLREIGDFSRSLEAARHDNSLAALTARGSALLDRARAAFSSGTDLTGRALTEAARGRLKSSLDALQPALTQLVGEVNALTGEEHTAQVQDFRARGIALQQALAKPSDADKSALITKAGAYLSEFGSLGLTPQEQDALRPLVKDITDKRAALLTPPVPPPPPPPEICQATAAGLSLQSTPDFVLLQSFMKTGNPNLNEALQKARDTNGGGVLSSGDLDKAIDRVATLERLSQTAPSMRAELTSRIDTLKRLAAKSPTSPKTSDCLQRVTQQLNVLAGMERQLGEFDAIARRSNPNEMRKTLYEARERASARTRRELIDIAAILSLVGLLIISYLFLKKYGDRTGHKELDEIVSSKEPLSTKLDRLQNFVIHNTYSLKINRKAVAAFARLVPRDAQGLARLSAVVDARGARGSGNLHMEVVAQLNEQVKGLQNELSHSGGRAVQENHDLASALDPKAPVNAG